jgi:exodeoxyribonuclease VII large subunit
VQGVEAPAQIVAALAAANLRAETELIILCRGGGSLEDLWAFNDERVVRAVAGSALPVVCGVGHETDVTLADLAADLRAPTPTAAAELSAPARDEQLRGLQARAEWLSRRVHQRLEGAAQRLDTLSLRLQQPAHLLRRQSAQLDALERRCQAAAHQALRLAEQGRQHRAERLGRAARVMLQQQAARLAQQAARVVALDPRQVLSRGYAWVEDEDGRPLVSSLGLAVGQPLRAVWADGAAHARVTSLEPDADTRGAGGTPTPAVPKMTRLRS